MTTLKLKKPAGQAPTTPARGARPPVRGANAGVRVRPTQAEAVAYRARRDETRRAEADAPERETTRPTVTAKEAQPRRHGAARPQARRDARPAGAPPDRGSGSSNNGPRASPFDKPRAMPQVKPRVAPRDRSEVPRDRGDAAPRDVSSYPRSTAANTAHAPRHPEPPGNAPRAKPRASIETDHADGSLRLSKRMSQLGIASRREADEWIALGWVRVDGRIVNELGARVLPSQHVTVDAKARNQQAERVTVLVNKPIGYVSGQAEDGHEPAFVLVTPENQWRADHSGRQFLRTHLRSLVPAGRLDIDSTGLLVLTQDGRIAKQLVGEGGELEKEYLVRVSRLESGGWKPEKLALLRHGLTLDDEALRPALVEWINDDQLRFVLRQGKKRQIRRMCEAVGLHVVGLKRVRIGTVMLGDLPLGQWRYLRYDEAFSVMAAAQGSKPVDVTDSDRSVHVEVAAEQADQADHDQVDGDDVVEQARHREDEDAGDQ